MSSPSSSSPSEMPRMPRIKVDNISRAVTLCKSYASVLHKLGSSLPASNVQPPRLVCVSKLKTASDILALHDPHQWTDRVPKNDTYPARAVQDLLENPAIHFGENYVQELLEKSRLLPKTIRWHFIGGLQTNKALQLARDIPNLWAVESVDTTQKASKLNQGWRQRENETEPKKLRIFIQINTSGEENKSGVSPALPSPKPNHSVLDDTEARNKYPLLALVAHVQNECPLLQLQGLMTIGALARSQATTPETENEDFICLRNTRDRLAELLFMDTSGLELSMGMSTDYEAAIRQGSDEVRVGSTIFGERPPKKEAKIIDDIASDEK
ncbi:MAG: hypothetical protein Q9227_007772 [Pyrenula ochraceoflavens]